jgi:hypothetical protein
MALVDYQGLVLETVNRRPVEAPLCCPEGAIDEACQKGKLLGLVAGQSLGEFRLPGRRQLCVQGQVIVGILADEDVGPMVGDAYRAACGQDNQAATIRERDSKAIVMGTGNPRLSLCCRGLVMRLAARRECSAWWPAS